MQDLNEDPAILCEGCTRLRKNSCVKGHVRADMWTWTQKAIHDASGKRLRAERPGKRCRWYKPRKVRKNRHLRCDNDDNSRRRLYAFAVSIVKEVGVGSALRMLGVDQSRPLPGK